MANLTIAKANFPTATNSSLFDNLKTPDPKEITSGGTTSATMGLDLGSSISADTFLFGFISSNVTAVSFYAGASIGATTTLLGNATLGGTTARRRHAFLKLGAPQSVRYLTVVITATAGGWTAGIALAGLSLQPTWGHEWGSGRIIADRSEKTPLRGGGWGIELGAKVPGWQFTVGDLTNVELASLWDIMEDVGESSPVIVCEDPGAAQPDLNLGLHYGLFDKPEAYERQSFNINRWSFRVLGWI